MGLLLALFMIIGCLPLNTIETYAAKGDVVINEENFPDENFRNYVKTFDDNGDDSLSKAELDNVTEIDVDGKTIGSLEGLKYFKNLRKLKCSSNSLSKLDVSTNIKLDNLQCNNNQLSELDLSKNANLEHLWCYNNQLTKLELGDNTILEYLDCSDNQLSELNANKQTKLDTLYCNDNQLTKLELGDNTILNILKCNNNQLSKLDASKNTKIKHLWCNNNQLTNLDLSSNAQLETLICSNQQYDITVIKGIREFKYSKFPGQFNKDNVTSPAGARFDDDALTVDSDTTTKVTYNYKVGYKNNEMDVELNVNCIEFNPEHVESMVVKEQPKLSYTEGEKLDLAGLEVTLTDNQGLTKDVAFKDFASNGITTNPENGTALTLADNGKEVILTKRNSTATAQTNALTVNEKVFDSAHVESMAVKTQPKKLVYTEGEKLALAGLVVTLTDKNKTTKDVAFKDFADNRITTNPENGTALTLADNRKPVTLTKGSLQDETANLTVNAKVTPKNPPVDRDGSYWTYSHGSSNTTKVNASQAKKVVNLQAGLIIGSKILRKSLDGVEEKIMMDIAPFIEKDRTMLPIRFVAEALGFNVQWDNENRTVILIDEENVVKIPVDTNKIIVNEKVYESDVKPVIRNNRTMLQIANIARALGLKDGKDIFWNGNTKEVLITREVSK